MSDSVQLLVFGDIHAELDALGYGIISALSSGEPYDMVVCTGDFGCGALKPGTRKPTGIDRKLYQASVRAVFDSLALVELPVVFVPGNHDEPGLPSEGRIHSVDVLAGVAPLRQRGWTFVGCGGSPYTPPRFMNEWNDSNIGDALGAGLQGGDTAIWLAHSPPLGAHYDVGGRYDEHLGSAALRELVEQERPRLVLCGHVH